MRRALELFSGTQSFGEVARKRGFQVVSLDINDYSGKHVPTHKADILTWDYRQYPPGHFEVVWASPPCVYYSAALQRCNLNRRRKDGTVRCTQARWDAGLALADRWVKRTLEIIDYFQPKRWYLENPGTGMLKDRPFMQHLPSHTVDYCRYSDWGYRKRTRIWTNVAGFSPLVCNRRCGNMVGRKHRLRTDNGKGGTSTRLRYRVPPRLIKGLLSAKIQKKVCRV